MFAVDDRCSAGERAMFPGFSRRGVIGGIPSSAACARITRAQRETGEVRFVRQIGLGYLQGYLIEAQNLLDKHARALGHRGVKARSRPVASRARMTALLPGGRAEMVTAGSPPFLVLWDKSSGKADV